MPNETPIGPAGAPHGRGHSRRSPREQSPLQARSTFIQDWRWEFIDSLNRGACARGGAQHGFNRETQEACAREWAEKKQRILSAANASLYALCAAVVCSLGYVPSLGFIHDAGTLPFIYDVADLYKHLTSIRAAFLAVRQ